MTTQAHLYKLGELLQVAPAVYDVPMRGGRYLAQLVLPRDLRKDEADRLCKMIQALPAQPTTKE